jgi:hypothetical protein
MLLLLAGCVSAVSLSSSILSPANNSLVDPKNSIFTCNATAATGNSLVNISLWSNWTTPPPYSMCYQEFANKSTACGGLSTGQYALGGSWESGGSATYDGDWGTSDAATSTLESYLYVNYTIPTGAVQSSSYWLVEDVGATTNLTIPSSCWGATKVYFQVDSQRMGPPARNVFWSCWNYTSSTWVYLRNYSGSGYLWEEAMWWNLSTTYVGWYLNQTKLVSGATNQTSFTLSGFTSGTKYTWGCQAGDTVSSVYDSQGNYTFTSGTSAFIRDTWFKNVLWVGA